MIGRVRVWSQRGFGWVETARGDVFFVHVADLVHRQELVRGQAVTFRPVRTRKGPRAVVVEVLESGGVTSRGSTMRPAQAEEGRAVPRRWSGSAWPADAGAHEHSSAEVS